ncbi:MAG: phytoene/squalene synthase family protein [Bacteroidota bacterium]
MKLYHQTCTECSQLITQRYSTSFSMGIRLFDKKFRGPIYSIYGFVRFADEIVDTFHDYPKAELLDNFKADTYKAIEQGISLNPVLHSFQLVVNKYGIERELIDAFLKSMEMDLYHNQYEDSLYKEYIYGSAEVVGLMCMRVFCEGDEELFERLRAPACSLGAAFQKVNFLRDIRSDYDDRGRVYFPGVDFSNFSNNAKLEIEKDIQHDFDMAYKGIIKLPKSAKYGVYLAYIYYLNLFKKICRTNANRITQERIRVHDGKKIMLLCSSAVKSRLNIM